MNSEVTIAQVSARLRAIRISRSLSLSDVEILSKGSLKAVVLGSYERGARTLSVKRAISIAALYDVPLAQLFTEVLPVEVISALRTVIDLRAVNRRALDESHPSNANYLLLARLAQKLIRSRQDWNGEVLSIRHSDMETISVLFDLPISQVLQWLEAENLLLKLRQS
jgi:transcriptional regulator with XRE-family HTH domain